MSESIDDDLTMQVSLAPETIAEETTHQVSLAPETIAEETTDTTSMIIMGAEKDADEEEAKEGESSSSSSFKEADEGAADEAGGQESSDADPETRDTGETEGGDSSSGDDLGSDEASAAEEGAASSERTSSDTTDTEMSRLEKPGKMVSRALEYDIQDMYPEITLLFEDKQSAWNCQDPAIIRAMWLESRTNILREWKLRNGKIKAKDKPKLEVKPTVTVTLRKQYREEQLKMKDWKEMYIPPGNDPPTYKQLQLPTNLTTEVRYNFVRNNPPVPSSYVLHYEKYRRPPFNVYQPQKCNRSVTQ